MPRPQKKSETKKLAVAVMLGAILVVILFLQFRRRPHRESDDAISQVSTESVARISSYKNEQLAIDRITTKTTSKGKAESTEPTDDHTLVPLAPELPRIEHHLIAQWNPFVEVQDVSGDQLVEAAITDQSDSDVIEPMAQVQPPKVSAVYLTPDGAVGLIDGQLMPLNDPRPAIDSLRAGWGNDYSQSIQTAEE